MLEEGKDSDAGGRKGFGAAAGPDVPQLQLDAGTTAGTGIN